MSDQTITFIIIAVAVALLAWPRIARAFGLGPGMRPDEVKARLDAGRPLILLDVRDRAELTSGVLPGAVSIPLGELAGRVDEITRQVAQNPEIGVVVVCQSGLRATRGLTLLAAAGLTRITILKGGVSAWRRAGLPVQDSPFADLTNS